VLVVERRVDGDLPLDDRVDAAAGADGRALEQLQESELAAETDLLVPDRHHSSVKATRSPAEKTRWAGACPGSGCQQDEQGDGDEAWSHLPCVDRAAGPLKGPWPAWHDGGGAW
jgi:hypothetical protein